MKSISITLFIFFILLLKSTFSAAAFYQINSETVSLPNAAGVQGDLKLLVGLEDLQPDLFSTIFRKNRFAVGGYSLYQSSTNPTYFLRYGPIVQLRTEFLTDHLYFVYEYHNYQYQSSLGDLYTFQNENRFGLFYSRYDKISGPFDLDSYGETFYIPEVSTTHLLSVLRLTVLNKGLSPVLFPLAEIYLKDSPPLFGGKRNDLRLGVQYSPANWISAKLMGNLLPASDTSSSSFLFQLDIFKESSL